MSAWGCPRCGTDANWATRSTCRNCGAAAPRKVLDAIACTAKKPKPATHPQPRGQWKYGAPGTHPQPPSDGKQAKELAALRKELAALRKQRPTTAEADAEMPPAVEDTAAISTLKAKLDRIAKACAEYAELRGTESTDLRADELAAKAELQHLQAARQAAKSLPQQQREATALLQKAEKSLAFHSEQRTALQEEVDQATAALGDNTAWLEKRTREIEETKAKLAALAAQQSTPTGTSPSQAGTPSQGPPPQVSLAGMADLFARQQGFQPEAVRKALEQTLQMVQADATAGQQTQMDAEEEAVEEKVDEILRLQEERVKQERAALEARATELQGKLQTASSEPLLVDEGGSFEEITLEHGRVRKEIERAEKSILALSKRLRRG